MKCTKIYNAHAQLLFCSLKVLFSDVPVAVEVFFNSLKFPQRIVVEQVPIDPRQKMTAFKLFFRSYLN